MNQDTISDQQIKESISESLRPFIRIGQSCIPARCVAIVSALSEATKLLEDIILIPKCIDLIFGSTEFTAKMSLAGRFVFTTTEDTINACFKDMIFLDCDKMLIYPPPLQVAQILEEFVHIFLNIKDEKLAQNVVGLLYNKVNVVNEQYFLK